MSAYFEIHEGKQGYSIIRTVYDDYGCVVMVDYLAGGFVYTREWAQRKAFRFRNSARRAVGKAKERLAA